MIRFTYRVQKATAPKYPPLTGTEKAVRDALLAAVAHIQNQVRVADIVDALDRNDVDEAVRLVRFEFGEEFLQSALPKTLRTAYEAAAVEAGAQMALGPFVWHFDFINARVIDWLRENVAKLIREWGESSREAVKDAIDWAFQHHVPPAKLGREIRDSKIGLTTRLQRAVDRYEQGLIDQGYAADKVARMTQRYYNRLLRYRTEMIARTEMARARTEAHREAWRQAIEKGLIDPPSYEIERVATHDNRVCQNCLEMDGMRTSVPDGMFEGPDGPVRGPIHPGDRCVEILVPKGSAKIPRAAVNIPGDRGIRPISTLRKTPPWRIEERDGEYLVVGVEDGKVFGHHKTREEAVAQLRALYASVPDVQKE